MEAEGRSPRWKMHLPDFKHTRRFPSPATKDSERGKTERAGDRGEPHKSVTMAPTSRYLTDRQYVIRKPLFSAEQHTSILKKTHPRTHAEKERQIGVTGREENQQHSDINFLTRARTELTTESFSLSHSDISSPSASREDLGSPLTVSELRTRRYHEEPTFELPFRGSRSAQRSLSSSVLEVQRLNPPMRPQLTSTVLYPTYTPRSGYSRPGQTQLRLREKEGRGGGGNKLCSPGGYSKRHTVSPYQANYWACAIPNTLPPSPDRHSAGWDANKEYQALLDYTYPLRQGQLVTEWDSSNLHGDSPLQTDPNLQDSGIELDHLCSSTSLSGLHFIERSTEQTRKRSSLSGGHRSTDRQALTTPSGLPSSTLMARSDPVGLSWDSVDSSKNRGGMNHYRKDGHHHRHHALSSSLLSSTFIRSTSVLPQSRCVCGEVDEEFWPLPEQLEELQLLSRQVREVTAQLSQPVTASWESLGPGTNSVLSSIALPEKQEAEDKEETEVKELEGSNQDTGEGRNETGRDEISPAQTAGTHKDSEAVRSSRAWVEPVGRGLNRYSQREVEPLAELLSGLTLPGSSSGHLDQEQNDSLMQHIQVFCSHLEQLIQLLFTVSEKMELLASPTMDLDSVKSSLAEYQNFQREVSSHQPLTSSVLHSGQLLLSCINTTSPCHFKRHPAVDRKAVWSSGDANRTLFLLHPVCRGQSDPAQTSPAEPRGGPRHCGGPGVHFVKRLQDAYKHMIYFIYLFLCFLTFLQQLNVLIHTSLFIKMQNKFPLGLPDPSKEK
uniref:centrosomal protein of 68 kDa isoform X2 n=1 Tax=Scatophagus argus TaxID=75038 RepID=UPI001ED83761|nr:centrosomal protein of 68 kDa isoform X2 [Scatophagus argus]